MYVVMWVSDDIYEDGDQLYFATADKELAYKVRAAIESVGEPDDRLQVLEYIDDYGKEIIEEMERIKKARKK